METPSVDPPETRLGPEADVRIHQQGRFASQFRKHAPCQNSSRSGLALLGRVHHRPGFPAPSNPQANLRSLRPVVWPDASAIEAPSLGSPG